MQAHLQEIARCVASGAHAVLLLDRAGWQTTGELKVPDNISLLFLPSRAPELNPVENPWQTSFSNRDFETYNDILDAAYETRNRTIEQLWKFISIGTREWAPKGHTKGHKY
jgi:transposase